MSAEEVYVNRKVLDLVTKAEMEREDYRRKSSPNVFFGTSKRYFGTAFSTLWINGLVILFVITLIIGAVELSASTDAGVRGQHGLHVQAAVAAGYFHILQSKLRIRLLLRNA